MTPGTRALGALCALFAGLALCLPAAAQGAPPAQEAPPAQGETAPLPPAQAVINYRERPHYPFDPQRLKLRPVLDGVIGDTEWTPLYTVGEGPVKGTVYVNWDDDFLYLAARTDRPAWVVFDVDASDDGWLRGADNLELSVAPLGPAQTPLGARILDAAGNKDAPVWNDRVVDPRTIQIVQKEAGAGQVIEMALPKGLAGLAPRANGQVGFRADFLPAGPPPAPTAAYEPHLLIDLMLVESRTTGAPGIAPRLVLEDAEVIPGQTLRATMELTNQVDEDRTVRAITWQGEGPAADILKTVREVALPPLKGQSTLKIRYDSPLPDTAVPGFYQVSATCQLDTGAVVGGTSSFTVVEPIRLAMTVEPDALTILGPVEVRVVVDVTSAAPGYTRGELEVAAPAGWEVKGRARKSFSVPRENGTSRSQFFLSVPSSTQAGDYMLDVTVTWHGKTWKAHRVVKVSRPGSSPASAPTTDSQP